MNCAHANIADPPPGKTLRICLDCCKRLIECSSCDAITTARADISESGWTKFGATGLSTQYECPNHRRPPNG